MTNKNSHTKITPEKILRDWAKERGLNNSELSRALGYKNNQVQRVIGPTQFADVTFDLIGRLAYTFEDDSPVSEMVKAMKQG